MENFLFLSSRNIRANDIIGNKRKNFKFIATDLDRTTSRVTTESEIFYQRAVVTLILLS